MLRNCRNGCVLHTCRSMNNRRRDAHHLPKTRPNVSAPLPELPAVQVSVLAAGDSRRPKDPQVARPDLVGSRGALVREMEVTGKLDIGVFAPSIGERTWALYAATTMTSVATILRPAPSKFVTCPSTRSGSISSAIRCASSSRIANCVMFDGNESNPTAVKRTAFDALTLSPVGRI